MSSYYKRTHQPTQQHSFSTPTHPSPSPVVLDKDPSDSPHRPSLSPTLRQDPVITVSDDQEQPHPQSLIYAPRPDKASRVLGIKHRRSMEPIPASTRTSVVSSHSARPAPAEPVPSGPTFPLTTLYIVSGLPKSPHTWTLADPDSVLGLHHSEGAVNRWWRPEVLGSTVSPGAGGGSSKRNRKKAKVEDGFSSAGYLSKQDVGKILSKALKLSFTREVEVIASTLQPPSTCHSFSFTLPAPPNPLVSSPSADVLRASVLTTTTDRPNSSVTYPYSHQSRSEDPFSRAQPSSAFLGPAPILHDTPTANNISGTPGAPKSSSTVTYHGVCLTVWSHADAERTAAIRRTLESTASNRSRKESSQSLVAARLRSLRGETGGSRDVTLQARKKTRSSAKSPWGATTDAETDAETDLDGQISESDYDVASTVHNPGESTLFLPVDSVFWLPYALTLVSRYPIYDLMRDYLTLSWARFSKDVQSHTLQISKILSFPAPRPGEIIRLDASAKSDGAETSLEVVARFPGGLDFGRGLVDINFTMWPLFKCLNIDNILTICEIALSPTGRVLFYSRHPSMLGIAVMTIKYIVELRGWNGIALPAVHARDAKIYVDDPGPYIIGFPTEARYAVRPPSEVCIVDLDINYLNCATPPTGVVSTKQQRDKYRQIILAAFGPNYHSDHGVPSELKEAFPAGRFRPICKIQAKRGAASTAVADMVKAPDWWHSTRIIQAFDQVLQDKFKKPSLFKRISSFGVYKRPPQLSAAELLIQLSIRKRATAFVDARDDLETKIGRLSRRLNFLMTESDLWRDKFVTFEQYAEKLSLEAQDLRSKVNKEQREAKRLSGIVSTTNGEKVKLQTQLKEAENAHRDAVAELEKMRDAMVKMEQERLEMVAEVEAQIERALASMQVEILSDVSEYSDDSRSNSRMSDIPIISRRPMTPGTPKSRSRQGSGTEKRLRSYGTESTLVDYDDDARHQAADRSTLVIEEAEEEAENGERKKRPGVDEVLEIPDEDVTIVKRFSAETDRVDKSHQDAMGAVDMGISEKSDKIAQKVMEIQRKLETALANEHRRVTSSSESEDYNRSRGPRRRRTPKGYRSDGSSTTSHAHKEEPVLPVRQRHDSIPLAMDTKSRDTLAPSRPPRADPPSQGLRRIGSGVSLSATPPSPVLTPITPALTQGNIGSTDDEDMSDFQSAYSVSPRDSYGGDNAQREERDGLTPTSMETATGPAIGRLKASINDNIRPRAHSNATTIGGSPMDSATTASDETVDTGRPVSFIHV